MAKTVQMKLSENGFKNFKTAMKKMNFVNVDHFLKYCIANTIKSKATSKQKELLKKEMNDIIREQKRLMK